MKPLTNIKTQKNYLLKNFVFVVLLSSGISLLIDSFIGDSFRVVLLIVGIALILIVALFYIDEYFNCSSNEIRVDTLMALDKSRHVIPIRRFGFSEDLSRVTLSVFAENKTYEKLWADAFDLDKANAKGRRFVIEFMEYLFIQQLSLDLNSYFNGIDDKVIEKIEREQVPDVLLKNRVIEMISKPYEEREKFQNVLKDSTPTKGTIVFMGGEDGAIYDMFRLELPRNSKMSLDGNKKVVIKNKCFTIAFESEFEGFCAVLPHRFSEFYLKRPFHEVDDFKVTMKLKISLNPLLMLFSGNWKYLGWLDRIGDRFVQYFSFEEFTNRIGYESALTSHILFLNSIKHKTTESEKENSEKDNRKVRFVITEVDQKNS